MHTATNPNPTNPAHLANAPQDFPSTRLPLLANAAANLALDIDTHLPDNLTTCDHATVARMVAAQHLRMAAGYAWLAHTFAAAPRHEPDLDELVIRLEAIIAAATPLECATEELQRRMPMVHEHAMARTERATRGA